MKEEELEKMIKEKGLTAPRVTPKHIEACIKEQAFYNFPGTNVTVCCLTLENGFNAVGHSACADDDNFDAEIGSRLAFDDARNKVWMLEGYLLKENLHKSAMIASK